eukprot:CAMPEP_0206182968 /NCGR_PEP_ID=MMETSP0166-20121206/367_1 /ASSEMBLY_ACC=CAM_ASM_000260 /TAXON_ID=95228 /ORGANISM="Vannella robusta, Strain DIVA3 518/3/11/1/6" /LENGTH=401 /DNA_ID=CAMNT_0053597751 /DNA_START=114 /DNA_END=1316 /DNA_ORIENTATION=+
MGTAPSMPEEHQKKLFEFPCCIEIRQSLQAAYRADTLGKLTILSLDDTVRANVLSAMKNPESIPESESRAIACFLGMAIGDALGAPLEFSPVEYGKTFITSFKDTQYWNSPNFNKFKLKPGQWTDDASMGLCLAESLLTHPDFNPIDLRVRFAAWWHFGYRSAFGYDEDIQHSVGLGGSISLSLDEFDTNRTEYTTAGDSKTSGNGSLMRLAAVPIFYHRNLERAMEIAAKQSKTTHQGDEAAECCRLMTFLIVHFISGPAGMSNQERKEFVFSKLDEFSSPLYSVECLKRSQDEERHEENKSLDLNDRKWNWKSANFRYCESRAKQQPDYIGSYAMDALSMALHCVWNTNSFNEALLKVINLKGDSDTVGSITGQLAGSLYGVGDIPSDWISAIQEWDNQ